MTEEQRQKYIDDARSALQQFKEDHPELAKRTIKKHKTKTGIAVKLFETPSKPPPPPALPDVGDINNIHDDNEEEDEEEGGEKKSDSACNKPKRPRNAYILYSNEVRDQVRAANPDSTSAEIVSPVL